MSAENLQNQKAQPVATIAAVSLVQTGVPVVRDPAEEPLVPLPAQAVKNLIANLTSRPEASRAIAPDKTPTMETPRKYVQTLLQT